tara:strand:- start:427 stop:1224 length:798 start_codon:yes stop_codon:yes gene_type:complete
MVQNKKQMISPKLSALIVVHNEDHQLQACLETLDFADEIVVVLDRCSDDSKKIASRFTDKIIEGAWPLEGPRRHAGIDACSGEWIFEVDADERATTELGEEIIKVIAHAPPGYFLVPIDNYIGNRLVRHGWGGSWGVLATPRLFTPGSKTWGNQRIHPSLTLVGPRRRLNKPLMHLVDKDLADMILRLQRYTDAKAADMAETDRSKTFFLNVLRRSVSRFFKCWVMRQGWREGYWGFTIALMAALYPLLSYLKYRLNSSSNSEEI